MSRMTSRVTTLVIAFLIAAFGGVHAATVGIAVDGESRSAVVFDADADVVIGAIEIATLSGTGDCAVTSDGTLGFVSDGNHQIWVLDLSAQPPELAPGPNPIFLSVSGEDVSVSPDGDLLVVSGNGTIVSVVDTLMRTEVQAFDLGFVGSAVEICENGSVLVASRDGGFVRRFEIAEYGRLEHSGTYWANQSPESTGLTNVFCGPGGMCPDSRGNCVSLRVAV